MSATTLWIGVGLLGQGLFSSRFLVQWIASEHARRSVVPVSFWILSLAGGVALLSYAVWRRDPVFILGQSTGLLIYARNLMLVQPGANGVRRLAAAAPGESSEAIGRRRDAA